MSTCCTSPRPRIGKQVFADGRTYQLERCRDCGAWLRWGASRADGPLRAFDSFDEEMEQRGAMLLPSVAIVTSVLGANDAGFRCRAYARLERAAVKEAGFA